MLEIVQDNLIRGAKILVAGIGGCGNNAVNRMIDEGVQGVDFVCMNTDKQQLNVCKSPMTLQLGERVTRGLGAGAKPEVGEQAAEESQDEIAAMLEPYDMVFVTCGMGGGTGTGAAPIVARIAKDMRKLTVGVVTKPFFYEGNRRMNNALMGIERIRDCVDTLIVIPNDKIYEIMDGKTEFDDGLRKADEVLQQSVQGITDLINTTADINLDFADVQTAMRDKGVAHIGIGYGKGEDRAIEAVKAAVESPLLETRLDGATDIIVNIFGDIDIQGPREAMNYIIGITGPDVNIIFGSKTDKSTPGECKITVIATGIEDGSKPNMSMMGMNRRQMGGQVSVSGNFAQRRSGLEPAGSYSNNGMAARAGLVGMPNQGAAQVRRPMNTTQNTAQPVRKDFNTKTDIRSKIQEKDLSIPSFLQNKQ